MQTEPHPFSDIKAALAEVLASAPAPNPLQFVEDALAEMVAGDSDAEPPEHPDDLAWYDERAEDC